MLKHRSIAQHVNARLETKMYSVLVQPLIHGVQIVHSSSILERKRTFCTVWPHKKVRYLDIISVYLLQRLTLKSIKVVYGLMIS